MATAENLVSITNSAMSPRTGSREILLGAASNEFVFALVGHVGSGTSEIARTLQHVLSDFTLNGQVFDTKILRARDVIEDWATKRGKALPSKSGDKLLSDVQRLQNYGDEMRAEITRNGSQDHAAVARGLALNIRTCRAKMLNISTADSAEILPDGKPRAYILDCLRHPAEVHMLRRMYEDSFILIGVVCEEEKRISRIGVKYKDAGRANAIAFMRRDADADERHGQHVADTFQLSDYFIDNTVDRLLRNGDSNPEWGAVESLSRLVKIITHNELVRPTVAETAMHHASSSRMQSACLSRQVGAALVDKGGNIVATGTNEVPKAGGGVYGESFDAEFADARCAMFAEESKRYCRNTTEQNEMIADLIAQISELSITKPERKAQLLLELRRTRIGEILEFSRAVHAEMDAILSAARKGVAATGTRLFVTTFPCHYCARHIVAAGVDEVQYIEPYPKSRALKLHDDSIQVEHTGWKPPSEGGERVLFRPFSGAAPNLYKRAFLKDRELKDKNSGKMLIQDPDWGTPWHLPHSSYVQIEAQLAKEDANNGK